MKPTIATYISSLHVYLAVAVLLANEGLMALADNSPEEALAALASNRTKVEPRRSIAAHRALDFLERNHLLLSALL